MTLSKLDTEILKRRTFGIISHPDAGKTTLTEKLLLFGGAIFFETINRVTAVDFVQESSKSEPSSQFLSRSKF